MNNPFYVHVPKLIVRLFIGILFPAKNVMA